MGCKFVLVLLGLFFLSFISASFETGNISYEIKNEYTKGDFVSGWINISLSEVDLDATFETNYGDSITVSDLLELNNLFSECVTSNCGLDYDVISMGESTKILSLEKGIPKLIGFKFDNNLDWIVSLDFQVTTDAPQSCYNQFKMDVFNDDSIEVKNELSSEIYCDLFKTRGCFDEEKVLGNTFELSSVPLCQRVELPESLGVRLGAYLIGEGTVTFRIYNLDGTPNGNFCTNDLVTGEGEFFCDVNDFVSYETNEYYVCVAESGSNEILIPAYLDPDGCGFFGTPTNPPRTETASYKLTASSHQFATIEPFSIADKYISFKDAIENYLISKYGGLECAAKNCVVPIKIYPEVDQIMTFSNLVGDEVIAGGGPRDVSPNFYDLSEILLKYNSGFQQIYLDNASLIVGDGETFSLTLEGEEIFSQDITADILPVIRSLNPFITVATIITDFSIDAEVFGDNTSITNYNWDFGNGDTLNTSTGNVTYTYDFTGSFDFMVTVTDSNALTNSKTFTVVVETPIRAVNKTLTEKLEYLDGLKSEIETFSTFDQDSLKSILNLADVENRLSKIKIGFDTAVPGVADVFYVDLMKNLFAINVPHSITISKSAKTLPFFLEEENVDLNVLTSLGGEYESKRKKDYKDAVISWNLNNLDNTIDYTEFSADYGGGLEVLLNSFELNVNKKGSSEDTPYFVLKKIDSFKFEKNYDKREIGGYVFIPLDKHSKIVFSTTEDISFSDLPLFISPTIDNLYVSENMIEEEKISKWVFFSLIISLLILLAIISYIILQKWYAKKYESYLFKNKNDLYNLISFIESSKKKGLDNKKIIAGLKKSGWKGEQLRYIIRKYLGKRTGMFEIPIENFLSIFKKEQTDSKNVSQKSSVQKPRTNPPGNVINTPQAYPEKSSKKVFTKGKR